MNDIATDENGNVYVTGTTSSSDFPTTPGLPAGPVNVKGGISGAFATKLNPSGQKIIYSALLAGTQAKCSGTGCSSVLPSTTGAGIAIDGSGNALVAGSTNTSDLPVPAGSAPGSGPFVLKLNAAGNELVYLNYIGPAPSIISGISTTTGFGAAPIAADAAGDAYIAGYTNSPDFQTTPGAYQTTLNSPSYGEAFAIKLNPAGATIWSTLLDTAQGGSGAYAISVDGSNNVWLTGTGRFSSGPSSSGTTGSFVNELSADGSTLLYSLQLPQDEAGLDIAVDPGGVVHVLGNGSLVSTIATPGDPANPRVLSILNAAGGQSTGLITPGEIISIYGVGLAPTAPGQATPVNGIFPTLLNDVQVVVNGKAIPLLYTSASQINAEIPSPLTGTENGIAVVQLVYSWMMWDPVQPVTYSVAVPEFRVGVVSSDFAVFEKSGGTMAVFNQDGTVNKIANPAKPGSVVTIWAAGFGTTGTPVDGAVATAANNYCSSCQLRLYNGAMDITETVQYAGTSPGLIDGLMQINFMVPTQITSNGAWVYFTPPGSSQTLLLGWVDISQ